MSDDFQAFADAERDVAALAGGELELTPVNDPVEAARLVAQLPPPDTPHNVVRPLRLPYDLDADVRELAEQRGVSISAMLRELIVAGLGVLDEDQDPVTELRTIHAEMQRALDRLADGQHRDAA